MISYNKLVKKERNILDFKDFCNREIHTSQETESVKIESNNNDKLKQSAQETLEKYSTYSQSELMQELIRQTKSRQKDGSLSPEKMEQMYQTIYSVIPEENRKNLDNIFEKLK